MSFRIYREMDSTGVGLDRSYYNVLSHYISTRPIVSVIQIKVHVSLSDTLLHWLRILLTTPFACLTYWGFWSVPHYSDQGKLCWYLLFYCLFQGFLSVSSLRVSSLRVRVKTFCLHLKGRSRDHLFHFCVKLRCCSFIQKVSFRVLFLI